MAAAEMLLAPGTVPGTRMTGFLSALLGGRTARSIGRRCQQSRAARQAHCERSFIARSPGEPLKQEHAVCADRGLLGGKRALYCFSLCSRLPAVES